LATRRSRRAPRRKRPRIPSRQLRLPAGFHPDGRPAPLRHVLDPARPTIDGEQLTDDQRRQLTALRISRQKGFRIGVLGDGVVTKRRALQEVKAATPIGLALVDIEQRAIRLMREWAERHPETLNRPARRRTRTKGTKRVKTTKPAKNTTRKKRKTPK
jgi:hypothetical protein